MGHRERRIVVALLVAGLSVSACSRSAPDQAAEPPAKVEAVQGSGQARVILSADAADRIGLETSPVREAGVAGTAELIIPYAAVLYDPEGQTWTYTNPQPLVFIRQAIEVTDISGDLAYLSSGPAVGTAVVTVGASELLGTEYEVGEE